MVKKELKKRFAIGTLKYKEDSDCYVGIVATTHPDREGDILSVNALHQIENFINTETKVGDSKGSYKSISLNHDWIHAQDPTKDEAAFFLSGAQVVDLPDGHKGVEAPFRINKYYKGEITADEIKFRIDNGSLAGLSIEYDTDEKHSRPVEHNGKIYNFVEELTEFGGAGLARARLIANPMAVIYKEIEMKAKEGKTMADETDKNKQELEGQNAQDDKAKELADKETSLNEKEKELQKKEEELDKSSDEKSKADEKEQELADKEATLKEKEIAIKVAEGMSNQLKVKEILDSSEFKNEVAKHTKIDNKILKTKEVSGGSMDEITLSIKEMNDSLKEKEFNVFKFKEASSRYFELNNAEIEKKMMGEGIPLKTTMKVKCVNNKLKLVGQLKTKDTLDTSTNTSTYTQSITEFADVYMPGIIDTFNNQTNLFGALRKVDHLQGGNYFGWKIKTEQQSTLSVDPDDTSVDKKTVKKLKLRTDIKEYRIGVSVNDYTLHHSRASMADLFMIEVESNTRDLLRDINNDLFTEQADGDGTKVLGLEAVADSAGNTTLYGLTRSTANRLAPATATDTYTAVGGSLTTAYIRQAARKVELEGADRSNLLIVVSPTVRDLLFELKESARRSGTDAPVIGFDASGQVRVDGVPMLVDSSCQTDAWFVVDTESYYIVVSKPPQLIGLAKVGAAKEAYVTVYLAAVYEQPRRIYMLDTLA